MGWQLLRSHRRVCAASGPLLGLDKHQNFGDNGLHPTDCIMVCQFASCVPPGTGWGPPVPRVGRGRRALIRWRRNWYLPTHDWANSAEVFREAEFECEDHRLRAHINLFDATKHHPPQRPRRPEDPFCSRFSLPTENSQVCLVSQCDSVLARPERHPSIAPPLSSLSPRQWPLSALPPAESSAL